jgi:hypothetical protein
MKSRVGHPTNMKEESELEEGDLTIRHLYNKFADAHVGGSDTKSTEKVIKKVHGDKVMSHMKKAANANAKGDFDGEERHFDNAQTAGRKTDRLGSTVGRGRSEFRKRFEEVEQLDELGNTPAGRTALKAVSDRGDKEVSDWNKNPKSGFTATPKKVVKRFAMGMKADRRLRMRTEEKDEQEYGYEGDMAMNQLKTLVRCAEMIEDCLKPDTDLPEWVQSKITLATDYIQTAADYLYSESEMNESTQNATPTVKTDKYSWGTMKTIHHGSSFSIPLHPEHHEHIAKMKDQQVHNIKTEDGKQYHVKREGDTVHFAGANGGNKTSVPHKSLAEETQVDEAWVLRQKKKEKKPVKEENMISFKDFITEMEFDKNGKYVHKGKYGTSYDDPEGKEDSEKSTEKAEKRGRGRPAGAKSGARQIGGASKKGSGVEYTGYKLHLPNSNK